MKLLTIVPVIFSPNSVEQCLNSIKGDLIVIDNGSTAGVKKVIDKYNKVVNDKNIYVNPVWNQAMRIFLSSDYTHLCILGSDVIMMDRWEQFVEKHFKEKQIMLPDVVASHISHEWSGECYKVQAFAGIFLLLDRDMVNICYPIPEDIKIWYGDNWIQYKLEAKGYEAMIYTDLHSVHGNSESVRALGDETTSIIEQDKIEWQKLVDSGKI